MQVEPKLEIKENNEIDVKDRNYSVFKESFASLDEVNNNLQGT